MSSAASSPAIRVFLDQRPSDVNASALSALVQSVQDRAVSADLCSNAALLKEVLDRLLAVANDGAKGTAVRAMALEGMYWLSAGASEAVLQGPLFAAVQQLNESFERMMEGEADALTTQQEMLTVVLLRCTGYTRLRAGDVLRQLCSGDERRFFALLLALLRNPSYEWALAQAALRWLYEMTTPATYFTAEAATETTKVHAFQAKVGSLLTHCVAENSMTQVCQQLSALWARSAAGPLGDLARCETVTRVGVLGAGQQREVLQWAVVLRYVSVLVHNLAEFCDNMALVKQMQQGLLASNQAFLADVLVPFTMAAVHAWERDRSATGVGADGTREPFLNAAIAALRLLRFALYRADPKAIQAPLLSSLFALTQYVTRVEPALKEGYPGMVILLLTVQCGCNANAATIRGAPVDLGSAFEVLLTTIANDKTPIRPDSPYATSLAFTICFSREDSPYVEALNPSVQLVHSKFAAEEAELKEDAEAVDAIMAMQEQLEYLQAIIMQAALGQLLAEIGAISAHLDSRDSAAAAATAAAAAGSNPLLGRRPSTTSPAESPSTRSKKAKKIKHPKEYCCQLTGKLMREPVKLKNGHRFEYDALMDVVQQMGHVDPLTGEDVNEEFEVDEALLQEIADYRVSRAAAAKS